MDPYKIKQIEKLGADTNIDVQSAIEAVTGRDIEIHLLTNTETNLVMKYLMECQSNKRSTMQRKIIHLLCLYGMTNTAGNPDMTRIDNFIKGIGSRNPKKRKLYSLSVKETLDVLNQVERMIKKEVFKS